jgi:hypothetical protein
MNTRPGHASRPAGAWRKHFAAVLVLILLGVAVWSQRIGRSQGFLLDDCNLLDDSYQHRLEVPAWQYLPGVAANRPIGLNAFALFVRLFGEREAPINWGYLFIHLASTILVWQALYRLTADWWASLGGAAFFLLSVSAYLPIYWPVAVFDTLSTFFLAGLLLVTALIIRPRGRYRPWLLLLTLPLMLAAVKSKESAVVVIVPLCLMVFFPGREGRQADSTRRPVVAALVRRLREVTPWEVVWLVLCVALVAVLALTVISPLGTKDPSYPYYPVYTPGVLGRSFVFYLSLLFFRSQGADTVPAYVGVVLTLAPFAAALVLKNRWALYGWAWYVVFLLPLAALKNHYRFIYYPYPANIGVALAVAALFAGSVVPVVGGRAAGVLRRALPAAFVLILFQQSYTWVRGGAVPQWYDDYHARSASMIRSLKGVLPAPPGGSEVVLVIPEFSQFDQSPGTLLKVIYRDPTLNGALFKDPREAEAYVSGRGGASTFLATWKGDGFDLKAPARP